MSIRTDAGGGGGSEKRLEDVLTGKKQKKEQKLRLLRRPERDRKKVTMFLIEGHRRSPGANKGRVATTQVVKNTSERKLGGP